MLIEEFIDRTGKSHFKEWFDKLDAKTALHINTILTRMKQGNHSNIKGIGGGVFERTIDQGPGYRIYFGKEGNELVILLCGGTKRGQQKDIDKAKVLWQEYKTRKKS